jgi:hypothetical protein
VPELQTENAWLKRISELAVAIASRFWIFGPMVRRTPQFVT